MPPRGSKVDRLSLAELKIETLQRQLARLEARPANVPGVRAGRVLGTIDAELSAGGTVAVTGEWWDGSAVAANSIAVTARDFLLAPGETLPSGSNVVVEFMHDSEWWITSHLSSASEFPAPVFCSAKFVGIASTALLDFTAFNTLPESGGTVETLNSGEFSIASDKLRFSTTGIYEFHVAVHLFARFPMDTKGDGGRDQYRVWAGSDDIALGDMVADDLFFSSPPYLWDGSAHVDGDPDYAWQAEETRATNGFFIVENADDDLQFIMDPVLPSGAGHSLTGHFACKRLKDIDYD